MDTIDILKLASIPLVLSLAIIPGIIPIVCKCCNENKRCLSYANAFSGGVFLTMGMIHIYPQTVLQYHELHPELADAFPIPEVMFILGYMIILLFEKVVFLKHHAHGHCHCEDAEHHKDIQPVETKPNSKKSELSSPSLSLYDIQIGSSPTPSKRTSEPTRDSSVRNFEIEQVIEQSVEKQTEVTCCGLGLIIAALSIHSFFQGLALGVSGEHEDVFGLIIGIALHNWAESLSIGANLASKDDQRAHVKRSVIFLIVYAIVSPIGIGVGWALLKYSSSLVALISSALSGGTFIYIGATEVMSEEFSSQKNKITKFMYFLFGFSTITIAHSIHAAAANK